MSGRVRVRDQVFHVKHVSGNIKGRGTLLRNRRRSDVGNRAPNINVGAASGSTDL